MSNKLHFWRLETIIIFWILFLLLLLYPISPLLSNTLPSPKGPDDFPIIAESAGPAVVNIRTERIMEGGGPVFRHYHNDSEEESSPSGPFWGGESERKYKERSLGTGFIIDRYGYIATNHHVINGADRIRVRLINGKEFDADVVGSDPYTDLALIKIETKRILPVLPLGNSETLKVGQWVAAIGSPFGLEHTLTVGIVSAKGRIIGVGAFDDFIQTDASINPGNSGGPLLNVKGEVVGVNSAMYSGSYGIGFAVPVNMAKEVFSQLKQYGEVSRAWLGVIVQNLNDDFYTYFGIEDGVGVVVNEVYEGHPAADSGIEVNDIIREINGIAIRSRADVARAVSTLHVGEIAEIKALRKGKEIVFNLKATSREDVDTRNLRSSRGPAYSFGIKVGDLSDEILNGENEKNVARGVTVEEVDPGRAGDNAGIVVGDIIKEINHLDVSSLEHYKYLVRKIQKGEMVQMLIERPTVGYVVVNLMK